jgi:hypothetical protein
MNCNHLGMVYWADDTEEWYCKRCGDTLDNAPEGWTEEDIAEAKGEDKQ